MEKVGSLMYCMIPDTQITFYTVRQKPVHFDQGALAGLEFESLEKVMEFYKFKASKSIAFCHF